MRVLHCVDGLAVSSGGPSQTVTALTDCLSRENDLSVVLCSQRLPGEEIAMSADDSRVERRFAPCRSKMEARIGLPLTRLVTETMDVRPPDILHDNGLWTLSHHFIAQQCRSRNIPLVLHCRGMLEPWALNFHAWRKKIAWKAYIHRDLQSVSLFMATAEQEVENIRRFGFRQPIACISNGVFLPETSAVTRLRRERDDRSSRVALFLGRVHPIKGLLNLIDAWSVARPTGWRLVIAGPDESGHLADVRRRIEERGLGQVIDCPGAMLGEEKAKLFSQSDLFILPSFSENFAVVVAEALAYGLPVITTTGTPWREIAAQGCGWWVEPTASALAEALRQASAMPIDQLREMGRRGCMLAEKYDWRTIARQTAASYRWLLTGGDRPDFIFVD